MPSWLLVACDLDRGGRRAFGIDRTRRPAAIGCHAAARVLPAADAAAFVLRSLGERAPAYRAVVTVGAVGGRPGVGDDGGVPQPIDDKSCRLTRVPDSLERQAARLLDLGGSFTVRELPELSPCPRAMGGGTVPTLAGRSAG